MIPPVQKTPRWVPVVDGRADPGAGVFKTRAKAVRMAEDYLPASARHLAGAVRCWIAVERRS